jgi:prepilin-type N-terminal cleavage/methylation domain-containing protein
MGKAMKNNKNKNRAGFTLMETIVVVAVIVVLTSIVVSVATRIDSQSKEKLTENTLGLLNAALEQYKDFGYQLKDNLAYTVAEKDFFLGLQFPIDCNGFTAAEVTTTLERVLNLTPGDVVIDYPLAHDLNYSGSEMLYFFLSKVPANKEILSRIGKKLITNIGLNGQAMNITIGTTPNAPLNRFVDAWGTTLRYDYYNEWELDIPTRNEGKRSFPLIVSAGPDKVFDTADDIKN